MDWDFINKENIMKMNRNAFMLTGLASLMSANAIADTTVEQGIVVTYQSADDDVSKSELLGSYDLILDTTVGKSGHVIMYVEGASGPADDGVSAIFGEANGDAGSAYNKHATKLDADGNAANVGAFQVSELFYQHDFGDNFVTIGMMDAGAYGDGSDIANDEGASFITADLVNNTTIQFPNYTMGVGAHAQFGAIGVNFFYGEAAGFDGNYTELLHWQTDTDGNDKGEFILVEGTWANDSTTVRLGFWSNNAYGNATFDGATTSAADNSGAYGLAEYKRGNLIINGRFGVADDTVSEVESYAALAGEFAVGPGSVGLGYALSTVSAELVKTDSTRDDRTVVELFYRYEGGENWTITPAISSIDNSGLSSATANSATIYTLRGTYGF